MAAEPDAGMCADCSKPRPQLTWCPVWQLYLCAQCRAHRTEAELNRPPAWQTWMVGA